MRYLVRKIISLAVTLFLISLLTFLAFHVIPGDPAALILGTNASPEKLSQLKEQLGTDRPLPVQYFSWISGLLRGNPGNSIRYSMPVTDLIGDSVTVTLILGLMVIALTLAVSVPLGIRSARREGTAEDRIISFLTIIGISVPGFFLSIILMWIFGLVLHWFTPGGYVSYRDSIPGFLRFMIFPALAIAIPEIAILTKYVRTAVLGEMNRDYVRTARGKGSSEKRLFYRHVLKNAIVSVIPLIGMMVGSIFSGSIIVEQVFGVPGIGRLLVSSVTGRDFPLCQTLVMYIALIIVLVNFAVDILIQFIDPRIRLADGG